MILQIGSATAVAIQTREAGLLTNVLETKISLITIGVCAPWLYRSKDTLNLIQKIDLGGGRCCLRYNDCNHYGIPCALAIKKSLLVFKLLKSNPTMHFSCKKTSTATVLKAHREISISWRSGPSRRALLQVS